MSGQESLLRFEAVAKTFGSGPAETRVLHGIDFELGAGETLAIVGPSGSGKSTLLNLAGTLEVPSRGRVLLGGVDVAGLGPDEVARMRNQDLGFIFQQHHLLPQLSALENVLLPTLAGDAGDTSALQARAGRLLERVGLGERKDHRPAQLSGGERQRVAVVRALLLKPKLLLADEPTGSLDVVAAAEMGKLLREQSELEGAALLVVTHSPDLAATLGRTLTLVGGRFVDSQATAAQ
ncbi:MAG: lipoprotein-releasing system ATP-binding protein [Planctomycetota bacterium]